MTRTEVKKNRKRRRKIFLALVMILFLSFVLMGSTYAWFTANTTVTVSPIDINISTSQGLQISADAVNWKSIVTNDEIINASWSGVVNQIPNGEGETMTAVSTVGDIDSSTGFMKMFRGSIETEEATATDYLTAVQSTETGGADKQKGDFVAFDLFFQTAQSQTIYLTSESSVKYTSGTADKGIQNAARVAFILAGHVNSGSTAASAQALKAGDNSAVKLIWEPNYDTHTAAGVSHASSVYGTTTTQTGGSKLSYVGVKREIAKSNRIVLNSTDTNYFSGVTTTGSLASGIPSTNYIQAFAVEAGITKVRIYMWIEGQDVDCEDFASGSNLTYSLQFSILDKAA